MKYVLVLTLILLSHLSTQAQFDVWPPNLVIYDSLGNERDLDFAFTEGHNASLFYYWASWCPPCREKIEDMRLYADAWKNEYDVKVLLVVYDRQIANDSLTSLNYWRDSNLGEVGDLYFVHGTDADSAYFEDDPWDITPWSKNYLHRASDGRLIAQIGSSAADMDSIIRQFFEPVSALDLEGKADEIKVVQSMDMLNVSVEGSMFGNCQYDLYNLNGQLVKSDQISNGLSEISIPKAGLPKNQILILRISGEKNSVFKLYIY